MSICEYRKDNNMEIKYKNYKNNKNNKNNEECYKTLIQLEDMFNKKIPVNKFLFKNMLDKKKKERNLIKTHQNIFV